MSESATPDRLKEALELAREAMELRESAGEYDPLTLECHKTLRLADEKMRAAIDLFIAIAREHGEREHQDEGAN